MVSGTSAADIAKLNRFGQILYEELQKLPIELSSNCHPNFSRELRDEIDSVRGSPFYKVIGCKANEGGVLVSQESEAVDFTQLLSGRVINLIPVDRIEEAYDGITIHTQSISIYPESLKDTVRDECAWRGAQRLTSLGCSTAIGFAQPHDAIEPLRRMARWLVIEDFDAKDVGHTGLFNPD
jgi:hypothetical protein